MIVYILKQDDQHTGDYKGIYGVYRNELDAYDDKITLGNDYIIEEHEVIE